MRMRPRSVTFDTTPYFPCGTVAVAPFPFSDVAQTKRRPLVILSVAAELAAQPTQYLCAMITSTKSAWGSDVTITDLPSAGLTVPCAIRMKLFTLDARLLLRSLGTLSSGDQAALDAVLRRVMDL